MHLWSPLVVRLEFFARQHNTGNAQLWTWVMATDAAASKHMHSSAPAACAHLTAPPGLEVYRLQTLT
jgi:hypothetical protein